MSGCVIIKDEPSISLSSYTLHTDTKWLLLFESTDPPVGGILVPDLVVSDTTIGSLLTMFYSHHHATIWRELESVFIRPICRWGTVRNGEETLDSFPVRNLLSSPDNLLTDFSSPRLINTCLLFEYSIITRHYALYEV